MPDSPPTKEPKTIKTFLKTHRTRLVCAALLLIELTLSLALFIFSHRKFTTWYRTTYSLHRTNDLIIHTTFYIATCAPLSMSLGMCAAAAHYWRKKCKYGKYKINMRRKGRGYWVDPSDKVDGESEREAGRWNERREKEKKARAKQMEEEADTSSNNATQQQEILAPAKERNDDGFTKQCMPFFSNPYGWVAKKTEPEPNMPEQALGRSDSVRTCKNDEGTKRAVADIWGRAESVSGRRGEDIEMQTRRRN